MAAEWKFADDPHTGAYTTERIRNQQEPVLYVTHDADDGAWQFHGASDSTPDSACLVCLHHIIDSDPTIRDLADLPLGWRAYRESIHDDWVREKNPHSESDQ